MAIDNAMSRYQKKTLLRLSLNLNRNTEKDLVDFMEAQDEGKQTVLKKALRAYMVSQEHEKLRRQD